MARKREERAAKAAYRKEKQSKSSSSKEEVQNFDSFNNQLGTMGLELREVPGDGNCLFRALGDQLEGHTRNHMQHRENTVEYMRQHRKDFEPFVEDDVSFNRHVGNLSEPGTYAGNDAIVAFARLHGVTVVIHQLNSPLWKVHGDIQCSSARELHIAYHNGDHYNSVRRIGDNSEEPANVHLSVSTKAAPKCVNSHHQVDYSESDVYEENHNDEAESDDPVDVNIVQLVMDRTGCQDPILVKQTLESHHNNVDIATDFIINLTIISEQANTNGTEVSSLWKENGTGMRIFGDLYDGNSPTDEQKSGDYGVKQKQPKSLNIEQKFGSKKHLSNRQRKDQKRRDQKMKSELRKKQKRGLSQSNSDSDSLDSPTGIVQRLGCLNI